MIILKKIIFKEWYKFFLGGATILLLLITIIELLSGFVRSNVTPLEVLSNYLIELPEMITKVLPVSCMMAGLFCIDKLKMRNELTAIFASGFSRRDFILTIIHAAAIVAIFQFVLTAYLQPFTKKHRDVLISEGEKKFRNLKSAGLKASTMTSGKIWYKSDDYYFSFSAFDKARKKLYDIDLYYVDKSYRIKQKITAKYAENSSKNSWNFFDATTFSYLNEMAFPEIKQYSNLSLQLGEVPDDFIKIEADISILYLFELSNYIDRLSNTGINTSEYQVLFWNKFSVSIICVIFALISVVSIFNPNRRSSSFGKNIGFVFLFIMIYWPVSSYATELGKNSKISPFIACFAVPVLFLAYLTYIFWANKKLR